MSEENHMDIDHPSQYITYLNSQSLTGGKENE